MMVIDDSTTSFERQIECLSMERLENEINLTYLLHSQSTLMRKYVTEKILANRLEIFLPYLEIYSLDVELIMEVELIGQKHFVSCLLGSKETQLVELNECQKWMMKLVITGKTMTPKGKKDLWKYFVVLCESAENNPMVNELEYGLENHCSIKRTQQTTDKHDNKTEVLRKFYY